MAVKKVRNSEAELIGNAGLKISVAGLVAIIDGVGVQATVNPDGMPPALQLATVNSYLQQPTSTGS